MAANDYKGIDVVHNVILEGRSRASISGVTEVLSFDENEVVMETARGTLTITGEDMHVERLSLDIGELTLEGTVDGIVYADEGQRKGSFWSKIF